MLVSVFELHGLDKIDSLQSNSSTRMTRTFFILVALTSSLSAQNIITPKAGIPIPDEVHEKLHREISAQTKLARAVRGKYSVNERMLRFLPDAEVFYVCVKRTLEDKIFYKKNEFELATKQLQEGRRRLEQLLKGVAPWNVQTGLVIRAYRSRIDGSLQPYGLWIPPNYKPDGRHRRLDIWYHGRNNTLSEVAFIGRRMSRPEQFSPADTIVLSPYGRFCNAMKFAGETDTWEAMEHVKQFYAIDDNRISVRGFSMGGAATWHFGAHHASRWFGVNPGAGFVDTKIYQGLASKLNEFPWWEQRLWHLYDALDCAVNLENTGLVAYSGELDKQKQAADLMEAALAKEGIKMTHIIGPKTGHKYEPEARERMAELFYAIARSGRNLSPAKVRFVTYTLKYNQMHWVRIDGMEKHWEQARVQAEQKAGVIEATTKNVSAIAFAPKALRGIKQTVILDGQTLEAPRAWAIAEWSAGFVKENGKWEQGSPSGLRKRHGLQGPIDDAFMDAFVFVKPSSPGWHQATEKWAIGELSDATFQWRRQMRGDAVVKDSQTVNADDIKNSHLVLWGDPASNPLIERIVQLLPIKWTKERLIVAGKSYPANNSMPALIYPNPLNPNRYVVINSGPTFMQFGSMSNSRQTPKLPDWAVINVKFPVQIRTQGAGIRQAGFFDEQWRF